MLTLSVSFDVDLVVRDLSLHSVLPALLVGQLKNLAVELDLPDDSVHFIRRAVDGAEKFYVSFLPLAVLDIFKHAIRADLFPELLELRNSQWLHLAPDGK